MLVMVGFSVSSFLLLTNLRLLPFVSGLKKKESKNHCFMHKKPKEQSENTQAMKKQSTPL